MTGEAPQEKGATGSAAAWIWAGLAGGAAAGFIDVAVAIVGVIGGLTVGKAIRLLLLAMSLDAAAAGLACAGVAGIGAAAGGRLSARGRAALAGLAAAPLITRDAFALFTGHLAASVPGHRVISVALALGGTLVVYLAARRYLRALAGERARALAWAVAGLAVGAAAANHWVLPRLYPWFHETLSIVTLVGCVLAVRLTARRVRPVRVAVFGLCAAGGVVAAILGLRASQVMRYAAHERTAVTALVLRAVPSAWQSPPVPVATGPGAARAALPPLPDGPHRPEADILLITIDALRADHVGAYGYPRRTTPNIDALAASGVRFTRAYAQAPHTSFSIASMLTGKYVASLIRLEPGERHDPVAAVLRHYGWKTAAFYPPAVFYVEGQKFKAYSDSNFDFEYVKFEYLDAAKRVDQILAYYAAVNPARSFVWVHFFEPHEPYIAHPEYPFGTGDVDRYDSEIAYTDAAVGKLVAAVRARRPGTIVVIAADHGEEFDEHGGRYHGSTLFEEQLRIPLIFSIPGVSPHVVDGQVQLVDVTPTLLNLLDIPAPARMRGTDLGPWLGTPPAPAARLPPAFAELEDKRMVVRSPEKLLCDLHGGFCAYYDLAADPHERENLADRRADRAAAMRVVLDGWLDAHVRLEPLADGAAAGAGGPVPRAIERGRFGDLSAAPELAALLASPDTPLPRRREAAELLVALPPRPETASAFAKAAGSPDRALADWVAIGGFRLGEASLKLRVQQIAASPAAGEARVHAALALAAAGDASGLDALADSLDHSDDMAFRRTIVLTLGQLGDRRAVPILLKHLGEVQNRREMVAALGQLGDPAAAEALLEHLRADDYVPVRVEAAHALAKLKDPRLAPLVEQAARHETEATVVAAARDAARQLRGGR
jgi:arylsulfatase A-like enzyme/HEAT repeat protein